MRKIAMALLGASLAVPVAAQSSPPKLLIAIAVDQLSGELYDEYRPLLLGGIGRLSNGAVFRNGFQSHNATETCPGHSTIMTGARPSRTGIIANYWTDQSIGRADKIVYCAEDERLPGTSSRDYVVSPVHLKVPTLGDLLKTKNPATRNVAVAGKDRSAVMMSGHRTDQRWYWNGKTFATDLKGATVPASVAATQQAVANAIAQDRPPLEMPAPCRSKATAVPLEGGGAPVGSGAFARKGGSASAFRNSPEFDGATLALAAALIEEMQLGRGSATDVISVGLAGTDIIGHSFGTDGAEMCLQLFSLDRDLGDFFRLLDSRGIDYMVTLTADHGGDDVPERRRRKGVSTAQRVDPALAVDAMSQRVARSLNLAGPVLIGNSPGDTLFGDVYLARSLSASDRPRVLSAAVQAYRAHPQVEAVITRDQLVAAPPPTGDPARWTLLERARASFDPDRSGDFIFLLKPHVTPIADTRFYAATHGSPWDYDRRVPIIFWRPGMAPSLRNDSAETVDIMPTLAAAIDLDLDNGAIDGKCLTGISGINCTSP